MESLCRLSTPFEGESALNEHKELPRRYRLPWLELSILDQRKLMLKLPLPIPSLECMPRSLSNSESSDHVETKTYTIHGVRIYIDKINLSRFNRFSVNLRNENLMSKTDFYETYVSHHAGIISSNGDLGDSDKEWWLLNPYLQARYSQPIGREMDVEGILDTNLYDPIRPLILKNLRNHQEELTEDYIDFLTEKGFAHVKNGTPSTEKMSPAFGSFTSPGTYFLGVNSRPDFLVGFRQGFDNIGLHFVSLTGLGETELPSMNIDTLTQSALENNGPVIETIEEVVSIAVNCGVTKVMLTNYFQFVLIEIDPEFIIMELDNTQFTEVRKIKSRFIILNAPEEYTRLCVLCFFLNTKEQIENMREFRTRVMALLKKEADRILEARAANNPSQDLHSNHTPQ